MSCSLSSASATVIPTGVPIAYEHGAGPNDCAPWKLRAMRAAVKQGIFTEDSPLAMIWSLTEFQAQIKEAQDAFPAHFLHTVATKANPLLRIIQAGAAAGAGSEAASLGELVMARRGQPDPKKIMLDSPAKTHREIAQALEWGVGLTIDNLQVRSSINNNDTAFKYLHHPILFPRL